MSLIAGIRFKNGNKSYYFDPNGLQLNVGDKVIVETASGQEFACVAIANTEVPDKEISAPLKPVLRVATPEDMARVEENEKMNEEALKLTVQKVEKHKLNMKLVRAEYSFDRRKITV